MIHEELKEVLRLTTSRLMHLSMRGFWLYAKEHGLSMAQMFTLGQIHAHEKQGGCNISMISGHLGVTNAAVSQSLDQLVQQGLALRIEHPQDRRSKRLSLTPKGREVLQGGLDAQQAWMEILQPLTDDEAAQLSAALRLLAERLAPLENTRVSAAPQTSPLNEPSFPQERV
jgi:DNA-binding MarR family transcriptional regulator